MQLTIQQLLNMKCSFHRNLYVLDQPELKTLLAMIDDATGFLSWAPPTFSRDSASDFTLVAGHVSYVIMTQHLTTAVEVKVVDKGSCPDSMVEVFNKWDKQFYGGFLAAIKPSKVSRPTKIKRERLKKDQICPQCEKNGESSPLVASRDWQRLVRDKRDGVLSCTRCGTSIIVTADELALFQKYQLASDKLLPQERWKGPVASTLTNDAATKPS
ncbi:MAG: hypothetical protein C4534_10255 [Gaiellales bacterium]|nr:MAG: hypothetical protein C4534_10255 [Gaiellales bacterium]